MPVLPAAHLVHFYSTPEGLARSLSGFFAEPLKHGETVFVVASPEHRRALDAALREAGVDLAAEIRAGRYRSTDVTQALGLLLVDGRPTQERFDSNARAPVVQARRRTGMVHMYGEAISTLVTRGDIVAAMELEAMWGEFHREAPFPLICGYPREALDGDLAGVVDGVASVHDAVLMHRGARRLPEAVADLALGPGATGFARRQVRDVLLAWGHDDPDHLDDAVLVVTELVGTAVRQGSRQVTLRMIFDQAGVLLTLLDLAGGPDEPAGGTDPQDGTDPEDGMADVGRSFAVLAALAAGWGVGRTGEGRVVWARLRRPSAA